MDQREFAAIAERHRRELFGGDHDSRFGHGLRMSETSRGVLDTVGVEAAIEQARAAAGGKDVDLMNADIAQQAIRAGLLDEGVTHLRFRVIR